MAEKDDHETIWKDFKGAVNMTASALEKFLETDESQSVGQKKDGSGVYGGVGLGGGQGCMAQEFLNGAQIAARR